MDKPKLNRELICQVMRHIQKDIEGNLEMKVWGRKSKCGTQCCFAGWAKVLSTPEDERDELFTVDFSGSSYYQTLTGADRDLLRGKHLRQDYGSTAVQAARLLGLTHEEANYLFMPDQPDTEGRITHAKQPLQQFEQLKSKLTKIFADREAEEGVANAATK